MPTEKPRHELSLLDYWKIIVRRRWIILIFSALVIVTTAIGTARQDKAYLAKTVLHIDTSPPRIVEWDESVDTRPRLIDFQSFYNTQYQIINSYTVKASTIDKLRAKGYTEWDDFDDPVAAFSRNMKVELIKDTRLVEIGYVHKDPEKAAEIANTIAEVYIDENLKRKLETNKFARQFLARQTLGWKEKKRESDLRLHDYYVANDLVMLEENESVFQKRMASLYAEYSSAKAARIKAENEYRTLLDLYEQGNVEYFVGGDTTGSIRTLKDQLNELNRRYAALSERYRSKFPEMMRLERERQAVAQALDDEVSEYIKAKEKDYLVKQSQEAALLEEFDRAKEEAAKIAAKQVEIHALRAESERNARFFKQLDERQTEFDLVGLIRTSPIEVIDRAVKPVRPVRPNLTLNLLLAMLISATGGLGLAFVVEYLDRTFKSPDEIEQYLGIPLLGVFPSVPKGDDEASNRDLYVYRNQKSSVAECSRAIRTNIMLGNAGKKRRTILVTSASPREGKSTLVANLGIAMALANKRTLLADTDLRRPRLHKVFNIDADQGVSTLFEGSSAYEESIRPTEIPNLFILPAGPIPENPSELLGSRQTQDIIRDLEARFDVIIFDSPPCIAVTDAVVLSEHMDGVLLVIKQESTTRDAAQEALRRLSEVSDNLIGCIMNNIDIDHDNYGYRYYYRYYYYQYYGEEQGANRG